MVGFVLSPIVVGKIIQPFSRNLTGEQTGMHGTVGQNSGSPRGAPRKNFFFDFTGQHAVHGLVGGYGGNALQYFELISPTIANPYPTHLPFSFKVLESLPRLHQILDGLGPMNLIKVNPIPTDSSKRTFHLITNRFRGDKSPRSLILHGQDSAFGCYNHLIAFPLPQGLSHCNLSLPETVCMSRIDPINPHRQGFQNSKNGIVCVLITPTHTPFSTTNCPSAQTYLGQD